MTKLEKEILETDEMLSKIAVSATRKAYKSALTSGKDVVIYDRGSIKRVGTGGNSTVIKAAPARVRIEKGTKLEIN